MRLDAFNGIYPEISGQPKQGRWNFFGDTGHERVWIFRTPLHIRHDQMCLCSTLTPDNMEVALARSTYEQIHFELLPL